MVPRWSALWRSRASACRRRGVAGAIARADGSVREERRFEDGLGGPRPRGIPRGSRTSRRDRRGVAYRRFEAALGGRPLSVSTTARTGHRGSSRWGGRNSAYPMAGRHIRGASEDAEYGHRDPGGCHARQERRFEDALGAADGGILGRANSDIASRPWDAPGTALPGRAQRLAGARFGTRGIGRRRGVPALRDADGVVEQRIVSVTSPDASSTARQREAKTNQHRHGRQGQTPMSATDANA